MKNKKTEVELNECSFIKMLKKQFEYFYAPEFKYMKQIFE